MLGNIEIIDPDPEQRYKAAVCGECGNTGPDRGQTCCINGHPISHLTLSFFGVLIATSIWN